MTITTDIMTLCAAIDAGDDSALLPLADALEEAGDPRAAGVRSLIADHKVPHMSMRVHGGRWRERAVWYHGGSSNGLDSATYRLLRGGLRFRDICRSYISRSAAFLALAEALVQG